MAITNTLTSTSIRKRSPSRVIPGYAQTLESFESWLYDDGTGDPWWQGAAASPYRWILTADVSVVNHSSHLTREPFLYSGLDLTPGMWVMAANDAKALKVITIISKTAESITCVVEDIDRYNTFTDPTASGNGSFSYPNPIIFFDLGDDGLPVLNPLPVGSDITIISQIEARFRVFNPSVEYRFFQINHGFKEGQVLKMNQSTGVFEQATSNDLFIVGTVTTIGPGPNYFYLSPVTKIIQNIEPGLEGTAGDIIWIDPTTGDRTTTPNGSNVPLYVQMTDALPSFVIGTVDNPATWGGNELKVNGATINMGGAFDTIDATTIINAFNSTTALHGVTAQISAPETVVLGTESYPSATPILPMQFKVNNVTTTILTPSVNFGTSGDIGFWDIVRAVNEQTSLHGVVASINIFNGKVSFKNSAGSDINFDNVTPLSTIDADKTFTDMIGVTTNNPASDATRIKLVRLDGGEIILANINGDVLTDIGVQSVANGSLPLALVVDKSMSANSMNMVVDLPALNAITSPRSGDQVYVQNGKTPGEWELYVRTGATWTLIADHDSAKTDASTMTVEVSKTSPASVSLGNMSNGTRIVNVTVVVSEAFSSAASLNVGTDDAIDVVLNDDIIDLSIVGSYESNTTYIYSGVADGELFVHLDSASSTSGKAKVIVSYL